MELLQLVVDHPIEQYYSVTQGQSHCFWCHEAPCHNDIISLVSSYRSDFTIFVAL